MRYIRLNFGITIKTFGYVIQNKDKTILKIKDLVGAGLDMYK